RRRPSTRVPTAAWPPAGSTPARTAASAATTPSSAWGSVTCSARSSDPLGELRLDEVPDRPPVGVQPHLLRDVVVIGAGDLDEVGHTLVRGVQLVGVFRVDVEIRRAVEQEIG